MLLHPEWKKKRPSSEQRAGNGEDDWKSGIEEAYTAEGFLSSERSIHFSLGGLRASPYKFGCPPLQNPQSPLLFLTFPGMGTTLAKGLCCVKSYSCRDIPREESASVFSLSAVKRPSV